MIASIIVDTIYVLSKKTTKIIDRNLTIIKGSCLSFKEKKKTDKESNTFSAI